MLNFLKREREKQKREKRDSECDEVKTIII